MLRYLRNRARLRSVMSAFGGKADITRTLPARALNVRKPFPLDLDQGVWARTRRTY